MNKPPCYILVMGVSGSGKSHIGRQLAERIRAEFIDADDHHSATSIAKMSRGEPLTDGDREGWLLTLAGLYREYHSRGASLVIACSALKRGYRDRLRKASPALKIFYLQGERSILLERLNARPAHFFCGESMLDSQLHDLEPPLEEEALAIDIREKPAFIIDACLSHLEQKKRSSDTLTSQ